MRPASHPAAEPAPAATAAVSDETGMSASTKSTICSTIINSSDSISRSK